MDRHMLGTDHMTAGPEAAPVTQSYKDIGDRLENIRLAHGISQSEFARRVGVKPHTYNGWLTGEKRPSVDTALDIRKEFGVPLDYLYAGDVSMLPTRLEHAIRNGKRLDHTLRQNWCQP